MKTFCIHHKTSCNKDSARLPVKLDHLMARLNFFPVPIIMQWVTATDTLLTRHSSNENTKSKKPVLGEHGGSVVECQTPEREVGGSIPTAAVLCP